LVPRLIFPNRNFKFLDFLCQDDILFYLMLYDNITESNEPTAPTMTSTRAGEENVVTPSSVDWLHGHSPRYRRNPGNVRMRELVESRQKDYQSANNSKNKKARIVEEIIETMIGEGCRFLTKDKNTKQWKLFEDRKKLHELVASRFRGIANKENRKRKSREVTIKQGSKRKTSSSDPALESNLQPIVSTSTNRDEHSYDVFSEAWAIKKLEESRQMILNNPTMGETDIDEKLLLNALTLIKRLEQSSSSKKRSNIEKEKNNLKLF